MTSRNTRRFVRSGRSMFGGDETQVLCFSEALILRLEGNEKYLALGDNELCTLSEDLNFHSFVTFRNASVGGSLSPKVPIKDQALVNLSTDLGDPKFLRVKSSLLKMGESTISWDATAQEVESGDISSAFLLRSASRYIEDPAFHRSFSLRQEVDNILSIKKTVSLQHTRPKLPAASWQRNKRMMKDEDSVIAVSDTDDVDDHVSDSDQTYRRLRNKRGIRARKKHTSMFSGIKQVMRRRSKPLRMIEDDSSIPSTAAQSRRSRMFERRQRNKSEVSNVEMNVIHYGEPVCLESRLRPGYFLRISAKTGKISLSKRCGSNFVPCYPEADHVSLLSDADRLKLGRVMKKEKANHVRRRTPCLFGDHLNYSPEFLYNLRALPDELKLQIIQFFPKWMHLAREMCKVYKILAEQQVKVIRNHNHFDGIESKEEKQNLFALISRCPNLKEVNVRNCDALLDSDFQTLNSYGHENLHLKVMSFGGCRSLGDGCIPYLARLPALESLNLAVSKITDYGLYEIAKRMKRLKNLNLYSCQKVSRNGVLKLIESQTSLRELNLRGTAVQRIDVDLIPENLLVLFGVAEPENIFS